MENITTNEAAVLGRLRGEKKILILSGEQSLVKVHVGTGEEMKTFKVHKALWCHKSDYFDAVFNGEFKEGEEQELSLDDVEPEIFNLLAHWVSNRRVDVTGIQYPIFTLGKLWVLADRVLVSGLQNTTMKMMWQIFGLCFTRNTRNTRPGQATSIRYNTLTKTTTETEVKLADASDRIRTSLEDVTMFSRYVNEATGDYPLLEKFLKYVFESIGHWEAVGFEDATHIAGQGAVAYTDASALGKLEVILGSEGLRIMAMSIESGAFERPTWSLDECLSTP